MFRALSGANCEGSGGGPFEIFAFEDPGPLRQGVHRIDLAFLRRDPQGSRRDPDERGGVTEVEPGLAAVLYEVLPSGERCPSGFDLISKVLEPLATLPKILPHLQLESRILAIGREGLLKHEEIGTAARGHRPFRLLLSDPDGNEQIAHADIVLDCTGTYGHPNRLGDGGIPAPGEAAHEDHI